MASTATAMDRSSEDREAFAAFVSDDETGNLIVSLAQEHGWSGDRVHKGGIANAVRSLSVMRSPEFLIVDLAESTNARADIGALADVCEPGTLVLALGVTNDVQLYRDLLSSGIHDYLLKPVKQGELRDSVAHALAALAEPSEGSATERAPSEKKSIAVIGVRGGVGTSSIATSLSWIMSDELGKKVGLLDLDIHFGTDALAFDLEPGRGLSDALENPSRVDSLFIERAMLKVSDTLSVLSAETPLGDPMTPDPSALQSLQAELSDNFDLVVMDIPRSMASAFPNSLESCTDVVLVTDLTLAATRDTIRFLAFLKKVAPQTQVHLIANKVPPAAQQEVSRKDFEASVERELDALIPADPKTAMAAKLGKTLPQAAKQSKAVVQLRQLAQRLVGDTGGDDEAPSFLAKLLRK